MDRNNSHPDDSRRGMKRNHGVYEHGQGEKIVEDMKKRTFKIRKLALCPDVSEARKVMREIEKSEAEDKSNVSLSGIFVGSAAASNVDESDAIEDSEANDQLMAIPVISGDSAPSQDHGSVDGEFKDDAEKEVMGLGEESESEGGNAVSDGNTAENEDEIEDGDEDHVPATRVYSRVIKIEIELPDNLGNGVNSALVIRSYIARIVSNTLGTGLAAIVDSFCEQRIGNVHGPRHVIIKIRFTIDLVP